MVLTGYAPCLWDWWTLDNIQQILGFQGVSGKETEDLGCLPDHKQHIGGLPLSITESDWYIRQAYPSCVQIFSSSFTWKSQCRSAIGGGTAPWLCIWKWPFARQQLQDSTLHSPLLSWHTHVQWFSQLCVNMCAQRVPELLAVVQGELALVAVVGFWWSHSGVSSQGLYIYIGYLGVFSGLHWAEQ